IDTGAWTGKGRAEITAEFPGGLEAWATQPTSMHLPHGETLFEAQERALAFFAQRMPAHAAQTVVVISHGVIGQTILVNAMGGSVCSTTCWRTGATAGRSWRSWPNPSASGWPCRPVRSTNRFQPHRGRPATRPWPPTGPRSTPTATAAAATFT